MTDSCFFVDCSKEFGVCPNSVWMAYAPLNGTVFLTTSEEKEMLEKELDDAFVGQRSPGAEALRRPANYTLMRIPESLDDVYEVDILSNFKCNFKCVYCYSAAGRSNVEISLEKVKPLIDYLFSEKHSAKRSYALNYSGGGEPLLSFPIIRQITEYIEAKAALSHHKYALQLVTNGSLLTEEIIDYLKAHRIRLIVSFEILEKYQNMERGQYDQVSRNIDLLWKKGLPILIRATLTPNSVEAMSDMVEEIHHRFPKIDGSITFDTVLSADIFKTPASLADYYDKFFNGFLKAKQRGNELGVFVGASPFLLLSFQRERKCLGKIVFTPEGKLSVCARISSPQEKLFDKFTYGGVSDGKLAPDMTIFHSILHENTIFQPKCRNCFARWNCGGGCRLFALSFSDEFMDAFCGFQKRILKYLLIDKLSEAFKKKNGITLHAHIAGIFKDK